MIWNTNEIILAIFFLTLAIFSLEIGYRLGHKKSDKNKIDSAHINLILSSLFVVLALLLGFSFSMSLSRFELRKNLVVKESNAISDILQYSYFLPDEHKTNTTNLLKLYTQNRIDFSSIGTNNQLLSINEINASNINQRLWLLAIELGKENPQSLPYIEYIKLVNSLSDIRDERKAAFNNHVPETVYLTILFISLTCLFYLGYSSGLKKNRNLVPNLVLTVTLILLLLVILDLDRPGRGFIQITPESLNRLYSNF